MPKAQMTQEEALHWLGGSLYDESQVWAESVTPATWRDHPGLHLVVGTEQGDASGTHLFIDITVLDAKTLEEVKDLEGNGAGKTAVEFITLTRAQASALASLVDSTVACWDHPGTDLFGLGLEDYKTLSTSLRSMY